MNDTSERDLVIFSGGGNPRVDPKYTQVYSLLRQLGEEQGYRHVYDNISWPGQCDEASYGQSPSVSLASSVDVAVSFIRRHIERPYDILARCYGCFVALKIAGLVASELPKPHRLILWGPPPYWLEWRMFVKELDASRASARQKGLKVDEQSFASLEPIESMLMDVAIPTRVAFGSEDPYCTPAFMEYLKAITRSNPHVEYSALVQGARHEVTGKIGDSVVEAYRQALWGPP